MAKAKLTLGHQSFIAGVIIAIIVGLFGGTAIPWITLILVILGLIVGFINITAKETMPFLVAAIALMVAGSANLQIIPTIGMYLQNILAAIVVFVAPAAIIVAIKAVVDLARR